MTYKDFISKIKYDTIYPNRLYGSKDYDCPHEGVEIEWCVGGYRFGSCWDDSKAEAFVSDEQEPEFEHLDDILNVFVPNITYLQYKKLDKAVVHEDEYTENCYYGNSRDYRRRYVLMEELYEYLTKNNLLAEGR